MFAEMRTGSNFLEANLNALDGVTCHGEAFNPHFIGKKDQTELFGITLASRESDPLDLIQRLRQRTQGLAGFRCFHDHDPRVIAHCLADPRCAKIVLTRNPIESYVSWKIAQATGQWKLTNAKHLKTAKTRFDAAEFEAHLTRLQEFQVEVMHGLQTSGQTAFYIDYDDLQDVNVLNGLAQFLGVEARLTTLDSALKKQNPEEIYEKVTNPAGMETALARLDRFNLARTPNFEPRRGAGVPGFVAATGAPVLFMPIKGAPELQVERWLAALGPPEKMGLTREFSQKTLRQWKRANAGHRSFTVIRHPLARAYWVFCNQILTGTFAEIRSTLNKVYKVDLPAPDKVAAMTLTAHHDAFLGFLRFLKLNLSGQTGVRVDPRWASQAAVLQGLANFQGPDLILREDRLSEGLSYLATEVWCAPVMLPSAEADAAVFSLDMVYDQEIEAASREAYQRDYMGFGFGPWRA